MRLDKFLKISRIIKGRNKAKFMCDNGHIKVNDVARKPCFKINAGDVIEFDDLYSKKIFKVIEVPQDKKNISKDASRLLTELVKEDKKEWL